MESKEDLAAISEREIAVLIPSYNEEPTIAAVVAQYRARLPGATIYVFDNASTDRTAALAEEAGAIVFHERRRGKGFVVQSMFQLVEADIYVMVDGDDTYPAAAVEALIAPIKNREADMVVGSRLHRDAHSELRALNRVGNRFFLHLLNTMFGVQLTDILSGYRAFSRVFVKSLPVFSRGFEIEVELTIKALERGFRIVEVPAHLKERPAGSHSKIRLVQDGFLILNTIFALIRDYKPLTFFGGVGFLFLAASVYPGWRVANDLLATGALHRTGSALLTLGLVLSSFLFVTVGLVLHTIVRRFQELDYHLRVRHRLPQSGSPRRRSS
jgi:glycosyltransferase involved in cell wall biosynthesis